MVLHIVVCVYLILPPAQAAPRRQRRFSRVLRLVGAVFVPTEGTLGGGVAMGSPGGKMGPGVPPHPPVPPPTHDVLARPADARIVVFGKNPARRPLSRQPQAARCFLSAYLPGWMDHDAPEARGVPKTRRWLHWEAATRKLTLGHFRTVGHLASHQHLWAASRRYNSPTPRMGPTWTAWGGRWAPKRPTWLVVCPGAQNPPLWPDGNMCTNT